MLLLSGADVEKSMVMEEAIGVIEDALIKYDQNQYMMPDRTFSQVKDDDTLLIMPCFVDDCIGLKVVTSYPSNKSTSSPVTQGLVMINNLKTGDPLALINGTILTAIKTAAVSGVGIKYLKNKAETVGLVGTGLQGLYQLLAAEAVTPVKTIYLYNRSPEKIRSFIDKYRYISKSNTEIIVVSDLLELINKSEVIITATTSVTPVLPDDDSVYENKLVIGVGSYKSNMRELPQKLFERANYYFIDSEKGKEECGDIIDPIKNGWVQEEQVILLSDLITGKMKSESIQNNCPIIFKTVNMALFDACIGNFVYKKAKSMELGQEFVM